MSTQTSTPPATLDGIADRLRAVRAAVEAAGADPALVQRSDPAQQASAVNMAHYLALRQFDLRDLQHDLSALGLSSLGRLESHVLWSLNAVSALVARLDGSDAPELVEPPVDFDGGRELLAKAADDLLGRSRSGRASRIMVTMPSEAATDPVLVEDLLKEGMDIARINAAHDGIDAWRQMVAHIRDASARLSRPCKIIVDLPGPKLRTGPIAPGPEVVKVRPTRDDYGRTVTAGSLVLVPHGTPAATAEPHIPVDADWLASLAAGERIRLRDSRGRKRTLLVGDRVEAGRLAHTARTIYLMPDMVLRRVDAGPGEMRATAVGPLPALPGVILLSVGDALVVTATEEPGAPAKRDGLGMIMQPARIGCSLGDALADIKPGERIWFDDGMIGGRVERAAPDQVVVRITHTPPNGGKLRAEKGINLPDTALSLAALSDDDRALLPFIAESADLVDFSFVRRPEDVTDLLDGLRAVGGEQIGIVLKIETRQAFEALPRLLMTAFASPAVGVMIARGDLAIECGYERLAEVQEEILWLCEAAHVPVIWATQVLESLAKQGQPSRAEITDAAMGQRAECVMLNKGPHIHDAIRVLDDILRRMDSHQWKKRPLLRRLKAWSLSTE